MSTATPDTLGVVAACDNAGLFGFRLWDRQREILAGVEEGPRLHVWALGRRASKTTMLALLGLHSCLFRPDLDALVRPGETRHVVAVATRIEQARLLLAQARSIITGSPLLSRLVVSQTDDEIRFRTGAVLLALPCSSRSIRGLAVSDAYMDEAAHFIDADSNPAAEPIFRALAPSVAQFGSLARLVVSSTPYGVDGFFADLFERVRDGAIEGRAVQYASAQVNSRLDPAVLEQEYARDPEGFGGEYLAEFVGSGGAFIDEARLREVVGEAAEVDRLDLVDPVLGLDLGFASDPTGAVLIGRDSTDESHERLKVGLVRAWAPLKTETLAERREVEDRVLSDVAEVARYFRARVVSDQHFAPQVRDYFTRRGVAIETTPLTAETKSLAFSELRSRIYNRSIELPDHPDLLRELRGLRSQFRAGRSSVVTPRTSRGHSDLAVALALGCFALGATGTPSEASMGGVPRSDLWNPDTPWGSPKIDASFRF